MADLRSYVVGVSIADNLATPGNKTQAVATFNMVYDGANWDMLRGTAADGVQVNLGANNDVTVTSGNITADTELTTADLDTGGGTDTRAVVGLVGSASGGGEIIPGSATDGLLVNLGANNDVVVSATNLDIRDLTKTSDSVAIWSNTAKDGSGTAYQLLLDTDGHVQVDVLSGAGSDTPTNPASDHVSSTDLAAGSEANLDTGDLPGKTLWKVTTWASVAYRARVFLVNNTSEASEPLAIGGGQAMQPWVWEPRHRSWATLGTSGGTDAFRVEMINLDNATAADVHAVFNYADN